MSRSGVGADPRGSLPALSSAQLTPERSPPTDDTPPLGMRLTKPPAIDANGLAAAIAMEDRNQILCAQRGDFGEGVRAFLEKRAPVYSRRDS